MIFEVSSNQNDSDSMREVTHSLLQETGFKEVFYELFAQLGPSEQLPGALSCCSLGLVTAGACMWAYDGGGK